MTTEYLLEQEVQRVLAALMPQNRLIVETILQTGLRISDVLELRTKDLKPSMWVVEKKTGKKHRCGLKSDLLYAIMEQAGPEWAFPGRNGRGHKTRQAVWADVKRAAVAFRLPQNVGTHSFRKVYAVQLLDKYGDMKRVQRAMAHYSPSITTIYATADLLLEAKLRRKKRKVSRNMTEKGVS